MDRNPNELKSRTPILIVLSGFSGFPKLRFNGTHMVLFGRAEKQIPYKTCFHAIQMQWLFLKHLLLLNRLFMMAAFTVNWYQCNMYMHTYILKQNCVYCNLPSTEPANMAFIWIFLYLLPNITIAPTSHKISFWKLRLWRYILRMYMYNILAPFFSEPERPKLLRTSPQKQKQNK